MKTLNKFLLAVAFAGVFAVSSSQAATVIQFYEPYNKGIADNLSGFTGAGKDGMMWGIIVDTTGNGFAANGAAYNDYANLAVAGFFSSGGTLTDDYYIPGALTVNGALFYPGGDGGVDPGHGAIVDDITVNYTSGISQGDKFALVWFDTNSGATGAHYGFFADNSFILPADTGATVGFTDPFIGADAPRNASNTFQAVPEPSRILILGVGLMGFLLRRRRI